METIRRGGEGCGREVGTCRRNNKALINSGWSRAESRQGSKVRGALPAAADDAQPPTMAHPANNPTR